MTNQLQEYQQIVCDECDKPIRVRQNKPYGLELRCDCESRSVKVKSALPTQWSMQTEDAQRAAKRLAQLTGRPVSEFRTQQDIPDYSEQAIKDEKK